MAKEESKHNIRTLLIMGLILTGVISAGCAVYWWGPGWELPGSKEVLTSGWNWSIYVDSKLGFSLMYPANWSNGVSKEGYLIFKGPADDKGHSPNIIVQAILPARFGWKLFKC